MLTAYFKKNNFLNTCGNSILLLQAKEMYSKTCVKKKTKIAFQDRLLLNAGQKYYIMLQWEHPVILLTFIKLPFVIYTFVLSIF